MTDRQLQILRVVARFDAALMTELRECLPHEKKTRPVWIQLRKLIDAGLVEVSADRLPTYRLTEAGRQALKAAA